MPELSYIPRARSERSGTLVAPYTLKLTSKAHSRMLRLAARSGVSGADILRVALDEYLERNYAPSRTRRNK
jgi:hypothetical protein